MPTEQILNEKQIAEIEARKVLDHHIESGRYIGCYILLSTSERAALCHTVRALRAENERLRKVVDVPPNERSVCDCHTWPTVSEMHDYTVALEARLSEVEKEREREREACRAANQLIIKLDSFRTHVINLCNEKAAECESLMALTEGPAFEDIHAQAGAQIATINELRQAIENLGIETTEKEPLP